MTISSLRICLVAQKSGRCYSPVGMTETLPCSKLFLAPHIASFRLTRLRGKLSTNPTLVYMNSLFLPIHQTAPAPPFDTQMVTSILETSSSKCSRDGTYSVAETMTGSNQRPVCDATPSRLKTTLALCAVACSLSVSWSARADPHPLCSLSQPSTWITINSRKRSLEKHATSILDVISTSA